MAERVAAVLAAGGRVLDTARSVWRHWRPDELARLAWVSVDYAREDNRARALRQRRRKAGGR
ncbi:hypothetical protein L3Q67_01075 [Saccharothrix sp. AJ9571]|nr:hypothetical protein L3Q67_01075 [Saccharothrix sp. AJ9571]